MDADAVTRRIDAPRERIYQALLDPRAVEIWRVPDGMRSQVHEFEAREGGGFRVSLTYDDPTSEGKSGGHTDTYHGHFERLVPDMQVVEVITFETEDPQMQGAMTVTTTLADDGGATLVSVSFENLPAGIAPADNRVGTEMALGRLAALVQSAG
jgi:uncharacterized protein YndB with AHSA1/START domain